MSARTQKAMPRLRQRANAFSFIELILALVIVSVLSLLAVTSVKRMRQEAERTACAAVLNGIGRAISVYTIDHGGVLPGPMYGRQPTWYTRSSVIAPVKMVDFLIPYLDLPLPPDGAIVSSPQFECPAARQMIRRQNGGSDPMHFGQAPVEMIDDTVEWPFGYIGDNIPPARFTQIKAPSAAHSLSDVAVFPSEQGNPNVAQEPVHGKVRNQLFLDGHVETIR